MVFGLLVKAMKFDCHCEVRELCLCFGQNCCSVLPEKSHITGKYILVLSRGSAQLLKLFVTWLTVVGRSTNVVCVSFIVSDAFWSWPACMGNSRQYTRVAAVAATTGTGTGWPRVGSRTEQTGDIAQWCAFCWLLLCLWYLSLSMCCQIPLCLLVDEELCWTLFALAVKMSRLAIDPNPVMISVQHYVTLLIGSHLSSFRSEIWQKYFIMNRLWKSITYIL